MIYRSTYKCVLKKMREGGIILLDIDIYFSHPIVQNNYGISSVTSHNGDVVFYIKDKKKFMLKLIKYGF